MVDGEVLAMQTLTMREAASPRVHEHVKPQIVEAYQRDGAVCIRGLLTPDAAA